MRFIFLFSVLILALCVEDLEAWFFRRSSSSSSSRSRNGNGSSPKSSSSSSSKSSSSSSTKFSHDLNKNGLTKLYNSKVTKVEKYERPLSGFPGKIGLKHTGVVATTKDGGRWLIHKGSGYGKASSTVVADAKHMSNEWKMKEAKATSGSTISDLMKAGHVDKPYGFLPGSKICWGATKGIMNKAKKTQRRRRAC